MDSGALVAVTLHDADQGDTTTLAETAVAAAEQVEAAHATTDAPGTLEEIVADKGYHSNATLVDLAAVGIRSYKKQDVVGPKPARRPHFRREEVHAGHLAPMRPQERPPRGRPLRRRPDAAGLQHLTDRARRHAMPELLEFTLNAAVAPALVLLRHPNDEGSDRPSQTGPTDPRVCVGPLPRDQPTMPSHQRVRGDERRDGVERPPAQALGLRRQATTLVVRQPELPALQLLLEYPIFLDEVGDDILLMPIDPAGHGQEKQLKWEGSGRHRPIVGALNSCAHPRLQPDPLFGHDGVLETEPRTFLNGHAGGNAGYSQGVSYGSPRQRSTLPRSLRRLTRICVAACRKTRENVSGSFTHEGITATSTASGWSRAARSSVRAGIRSGTAGSLSPRTPGSRGPVSAG